MTDKEDRGGGTADVERRIGEALGLVADLEAFAHQLAPILSELNRLEPGSDLKPYLARHEISVPDSIAGPDIIWEDPTAAADEDGWRTVSVVTSGQPSALGLTIGCIRYGRWRICLECGWFWCRVVIVGRF